MFNEFKKKFTNKYQADPVESFLSTLADYGLMQMGQKPNYVNQMNEEYGDIYQRDVDAQKALEERQRQDQLMGLKLNEDARAGEKMMREQDAANAFTEVISKRRPDLGLQGTGIQGEDAYKILNLDEQAALRRELAAQNAAAKAAASASKSGENVEKKIKGYRGELTSGTYAKSLNNYLLAERSASALGEFKKNPNGYTDYGTLMMGLKSLQGDDSVVREAEIRLGKNATSTINKVGNYLQEAANGKSLTTQQRNEIYKTLGTLSDIGRKQYLDIATPVYKQAKKQNLPIGEIFPVSDAEYVENYYSGSKQATSKPKTIIQDGFTYTLNEVTGEYE